MIEKIAKESYINIETFRKNGIGVKTPVWFLFFEQKLFVRTLSVSGKVKRIRLNSIVNIAPCMSNGTLKGEWTQGTARVMENAIECENINKMITKKYGFMKTLIDFFAMMQKKDYAVIEITFK